MFGVGRVPFSCGCCSKFCAGINCPSVACLYLRREHQQWIQNKPRVEPSPANCMDLTAMLGSSEGPVLTNLVNLLNMSCKHSVSSCSIHTSSQSFAISHTFMIIISAQGAFNLDGLTWTISEMAGCPSKQTPSISVVLVHRNSSPLSSTQRLSMGVCTLAMLMIATRRI